MGGEWREAICLSVRCLPRRFSAEPVRTRAADLARLGFLLAPVSHRVFSRRQTGILLASTPDGVVSLRHAFTLIWESLHNDSSAQPSLWWEDERSE